jgi:hypothetical protein
MTESIEQAWINEVSVTLERLKKAYALEGLGVHDGSAVNDVNMALGKLGMLERDCPPSLAQDAQLAACFGIYHEIARLRMKKD